MQPQENISEKLRNSIFAYNGNFVEYKAENFSLRRLSNHTTMVVSDSLSPSIHRTLSTYDYLLLQWNEAIQHLICKSIQGNNETFFKDWFHRLWSLHASYTTRHYHTVVHLEEMCAYLQFMCDTLSEEQKAVVESQRCKSNLLLAIFFHDAIYDSKSDKNEEDSAMLFESFAKDSKMNPDHKQVIVSYILATKHHRVDDATKPTIKRAIFEDPLLLFLDLDMAVLGKDETAYREYAALVRREYDFVPLSIYCEKRANILETFLQQSCIFHTYIFNDAFESRARLNLRTEIESLRKGNIL